MLHAQPVMGVVDYNQPVEYEIGGIKMEGTKYLETNILLSISGLSVGDIIKLPGEELSLAIKKLWKQKLFTDVQIRVDRIVEKRIFLTILVEERPRMFSYSLKGVTQGEVEDLKKKMDLRTGQIITDALLMKVTTAAREFYVEKGYLNVQVRHELLTDTSRPNQVRLKLIVEKGPKVRINHITFSGNDAVTQNSLRNKMKETREKVKFDLKGLFQFRKNFSRQGMKLNWFDFFGGIAPTKWWNYMSPHVNLNFFKSSRFRRTDYENDKRALIEFYHTKGYRDARIARDTVYQTDERNINIDIQVDEGRQYFFRKIIWNGNTKYPDSVLSRKLNIKAGDVFNQKLLDERLMMNPNGEDVSSLYMDDGYLFFQIMPNEVLVEGDSIDLEMRISEGPQATIREVRILGNTKTSEKVIRRELRTLPGNKFSRQDLIRSQREIVNLGYFDPQQMDVIPYPNPENGTVDIEYRVTEKPSDQLELSAGWGGAGQGLFGTLGVNFTNFSIRNIIDKKAWQPLPSGDGQRFGLRIQSNGRQYQSYSINFTEPWLGGKKPTSLTFSFNHLRANRVDIENKIIGTYESTSGYVGMGSRLKWPDDWFTGEIGLEIQHFKLNNYQAFSLFDNGQAFNVNLQLNLSRNSIDVPLFPTRGINLSLTGKFTLPYSLFVPSLVNRDYSNLTPADRNRFVEYHKWRLTADFYTPIYKKLIFRATAKMGLLGYYNKQLGYTDFERAEFGGDGLSGLQNTNLLGRDIVSLRGYPVLTNNGPAPIWNKFSMEVRYPFSDNPSATIYALLFLEGGNAWYDIKDYRPYDLKKSFGAGVRVFLPMFGLLGFDYGIGWDKDPKPGANTFFGKYGQFRIILGFEPE